MKDLLEHTLVLRLSDRPGAMEVIAATFAHRGLSLSWTLGNDGQNSPDGIAVVIVHFCATRSHKEAIQRVLSRLSFIVTVTEPAVGGKAVRLCALVRLAPEVEVPILPTNGGHVDLVTRDEDTGEPIYSLTGPPDIINAVLLGLREAGSLRTTTQVLLAL